MLDSQEVTLPKYDPKALLREINKTFGDGAAMMLGEKPELDLSVIPTGALTLDVATGIGGYPEGRIIELFGRESSGKSTLCLHAIAEAQKKGMLCAFVDVECALDVTYAAAIGVDVDNLIISQPDSGEQAMDIVQALVESNQIGLIIVDSVALLTPQAEIDKTMGESTVGEQARLMGKGLRKLTNLLKNHNVCLIFTNQIRMKIGVMYGNPETTPGGNALPFAASIRIKIQRVETDKKNENNRVKCTIVKNKCAPPFKEAEFDIIWGKGVDNIGCIVDVATDKNIIEKSGGWYKYGENKWQGKEKVKLALAENEELQNEIKQRIK